MSSSIAKPNKFNAGDKVFAKISDYPYWPALILDVNTGNKDAVLYKVLCYGSYRLALVKEDGICDYIKNKKLYGKPRNTCMSFDSAILDIDASIGCFKKNRKKIHQIYCINKRLNKWLKKAKRAKNSPNQESSEHKLQKKMTQLKTLRIECKMLKLDLRIKRCLNLVEPNLQNCLQFLTQLDTLQITPVMLKKHPEVVNTISRVKLYMGHIRTSKETQEMEFKYSRQAAEIRAKADGVYHKIKTLFNSESDADFVIRFGSQLRTFQAKTVGLSCREFMYLTTEPV